MTEPVQLRIIRVPEFDIKVFEVTHADGSVEKILDRPLEMQTGYLMGLPYLWDQNPIEWIYSTSYGR